MTESIRQSITPNFQHTPARQYETANSEKKPVTLRKPPIRLIVSFASQSHEDVPDCAQTDQNAEISDTAEISPKVAYSSAKKPKNLLPMAQALPISRNFSLFIDTKSEEWSEADIQDLRLTMSETQTPESGGKSIRGNSSFGDFAEDVAQKMTKSTAIQLRPKLPPKATFLRRKSLQELPSELKSVLKFSVLEEKRSQIRPMVTSFVRKQQESDGFVHINQYSVRKQLSSGVFAKVFQAESKGEQFAIKEFNKKRIKIAFLSKKRSGNRLIDREIEMLIAAKHNNVTQLHEVIASHDSSKVYLVTDYPSIGYLSDLKCQSESCAKAIFTQIFACLSHLHISLQIIHRGITLKSIQIDTTGLVKIGDFSSAVYSWECKEKPGFLEKEYISPEIGTVGHGGETFACDMWAAGVCLYWTVVGKPPFQGKTAADVAKAIEYSEVEVPSHFSDDFHSLVKGLLEKNVDKRLTAADAIIHSWIYR